MLCTTNERSSSLDVVTIPVVKTDRLVKVDVFFVDRDSIRKEEDNNSIKCCPRWGTLPAQCGLRTDAQPYNDMTRARCQRAIIKR